MTWTSGVGLSARPFATSHARRPPWRRFVAAAVLVLVTAPSATASIDYGLKKAFPNTVAGGQAGAAVAIVGARILVGVPGQSRVNVYDRLDPNPVPSPIQTFVSPNASAGDNFGAAVAAVGDSQVLIGAPGEDTFEGGVDAGAAYLFDVATGAVLNRFIKPTAPTANAGFGNAVAAAGPTLLIAASGDDVDATNSGSVYAFASSSPYALQQRIVNPTPAANDSFGTSLLVFGKGFFTYYAIGAPNDNAATGAVYVYINFSGAISLTDTITNPTGTSGTLFGRAIARGPTIGGTGTFLVGAPATNHAGVGASGEAYLVNETSPYAIVATFSRPGGGAVFDLFGWTVTTLNSNLVVGTPGADVGGTDTGEVYVFSSASPYALIDTLPNPTPAASDTFGIALAGGNRLAVGANGDDTAAVDGGAAYLFEPTFSTACWTSGAASAVGQWDLPHSLPSVAVHMILLNTADNTRGKVLFWQGFGSPKGYLWDPVTLQVTDTGIIPGLDPFCAGHATLKDGRAIVIGGTSFSTGGNADCDVFDVAGPTWTAKSNMHVDRFYPTATVLGDGRVLATEGTASGAHQTTPEVYDVALDCWRNLVPSPVITMETYPFMFLLPDGKIFQAGRSITQGGSATTPVTRKLTLSIPDAPCSTDGTATWTDVSTSLIDGDEGSAVMYRGTEHSGQDVVAASKVLKAGGIAFGGTSPTSIAEKIDVSQTTAWTQVANLQAARAHVNMVALPNGKVLAVGGTSNLNDAGYPGVQLGAEMWDPNASPQPQGTWTKMACMSEPRMYHSTALLLPDGSVLSAGGGPLVDAAQNTVYPSYQVYKPPYMFASRPGIVASSVPATAQFFSTFDITVSNVMTASEIDAVAFIRPGAVTHSFDQNQRYVAAQFRVKDATTLTVSTPVNNKVAPTGYYMLFISRAGVPSTGVFIKLEGGGCG